MTGARRTPLSNRSGAKCSFLAMAFWVVAPANRVPMTAQSDTDALEEEDNRNLVPDSCARACWHSVGHAVSKRKKLRPRLARPPHRGLEFMFEAQVFVQHGQGRFTKHGSVHAALAGLRDLSACRTRGFRSVPFTEYRAHALCPRRCGVARAGVPASKRFANAQQNAHRRDPSRGDPGGRFARQPRRRIRL